MQNVIYSYYNSGEITENYTDNSANHDFRQKAGIWATPSSTATQFA